AVGARRRRRREDRAQCRVGAGQARGPAGAGDHRGGAGAALADGVAGAAARARRGAGQGRGRGGAAAARRRRARRRRRRSPAAPQPAAAAGARDPEALLATVVAALTSPEAWALFSRFTEGPIRYRVEWADAGHRRALTFRVAAAVAARRPELVNDPTDSLWEAVVRERPHVSVELWPRGLDDPRFAYRRAHVPAPALIVTNPPLGRRVLDRHRTGALYRDFLAHAAAILAPRGRIVWISPRGDETIGYASAHGLRATLRQRVDMGGFWAELQSFTK